MAGLLFIFPPDDILTVHSVLRCGRHLLSLDRPRVMGILNVTPDSFSDGGRFESLDRALQQVDVMLEAGADIIDIGGESTRPGAAAVSEQAEMDRVLPVVEAINSRFDTIVSLDTSKAAVMREGSAHGVGLINDVRALCEPGAMEAALDSALPVCLMHMQGQPRTMQQEPVYDDVVAEVGAFLAQRRQACIDAGMDASQVLLDPGFGFGKTLAHNLQLLKHLEQLHGDSPLLVGLSRKRMFAQILGSDTADRVTASVSAAMLCVERGASIVRVHDVAPTVQALAVLQAVQECR